jgi:hypothetical protein
MVTNLPEIEQARYAVELLIHIANLKDRVGEILDPMIARLLKAEDVAEIRAVAEILPKGKQRNLLERAAYQIEEGYIPQGRRPKLTPEQTVIGARVVYSDAYLERHSVWITPRMLEREGQVVGLEHYDWKNDRLIQPEKHGRTYVHVRWDDERHENAYMDYDEESAFNLAAA